MTPRREMRILRLTPHFHREGSWPVAFDPVGGLQIQTFVLTRGIDRSGIRQTVAATHIPGSPRRQGLFEKAEFLSVGPWLPGFLAGSLLGFGWALGVLRLLARDHGRYDLVHIHYNHSVWCRVLVLVLARTGLPVVVSLNTALWGGLQRALRLEGSPFDITLWIERLAMRRADRVVALTDSAANTAEAVLRVPRSKIVVIPDAVAVEEFQRVLDPEAARSFRLRHGIPEGWRIVSYVGRISAEKGWRDLPHLVHALARRQVFLLICGDGPDRPKLEAAFRRCGLEGGWSITGFLPPAAVRVALMMSEVLILPSRREVFGSVLIEAMASGVPAVAYRVGGIVDVAGEPPAVSLAEAGDRDDLLRRIFVVLDDPGVAERLAALGRERVKSFTIQRSVALTGKLYESVLHEQGRMPAGRLQQPAQ
ncbi:glycosyltransferase [Mesorhizobium sp. KR9-304]|uniref:glycosyltransferase n=1 Tax=Mesorhizobium sp. KR9-304 TaxID=3156614 RepID=UPI0032B36B83